MKKYTDTFLLFGSLAFLVMWVNEFIYKGTTMKDSYFFLMFALAGFLYYVYRRGQKKMEEKQEGKPPLKKKKK